MKFPAQDDGLNDTVDMEQVKKKVRKLEIEVILLLYHLSVLVVACVMFHVLEMSRDPAVQACVYGISAVFVIVAMFVVKRDLSLIAMFKDFLKQIEANSALFDKVAKDREKRIEQDLAEFAKNHPSINA